MEELRSPERFITAVLIGNNVVNVTASVIATAAALRVFGSPGIAVATGLMTFLLLVFGEIIPKTFATRNAERVSLQTAYALRVITKSLQPIVGVFTTLTAGVMRLLGWDYRRRSPLVTEEEIKMLLRLGEEEGTIEHDEREIIHKVFKFTDQVAAGVMTPREKMVVIEDNSTLEEALVLINESGHSRLPVYHKNFDNIIGMVYAKDLLRFQDSELKNIKASQILRPIYHVNINQKMPKILRALQRTRSQIAVVEKGSKVVGLLSIEDIIEEIVGEILDEYDITTDIPHNNAH